MLTIAYLIASDVKIRSIFFMWQSNLTSETGPLDFPARPWIFIKLLHRKSILLFSYRDMPFDKIITNACRGGFDPVDPATDGR